MNKEIYCLSATKAYDYKFKYCDSCKGVIDIFNVEKDSFENNANIAFELATEKWNHTTDHVRVKKPHVCVCSELKEKYTKIKKQIVKSETVWFEIKKDKNVSFLDKKILTNKILSETEIFILASLEEMNYPGLVVSGEKDPFEFNKNGHTYRLYASVETES